MSTSESTGDSSSESPGEESEKEKSLGESASESSGDSTSESSGDASEKENSPLDLPGKSLGDQLNKYSGRMIKCDESSTKMYGFYDQEPDGDGEQVKAMLFGCVQKYVKGSLLWQLFPGCYVQIKDITGDGIVLLVLVEKLNHAKGKKLLVWFDERPKIVPMSEVISPCGRQAVELDVVSQKFNSKQTQAVWKMYSNGSAAARGLPKKQSKPGTGSGNIKPPTATIRRRRRSRQGLPESLPPPSPPPSPHEESGSDVLPNKVGSTRNGDTTEEMSLLRAKLSSIEEVHRKEKEGWSSSQNLKESQHEEERRQLAQFQQEYKRREERSKRDRDNSSKSKKKKKKNKTKRQKLSGRSASRALQNFQAFGLEQALRATEEETKRKALDEQLSAIRRQDLARQLVGGCLADRNQTDSDSSTSGSDR